MSGKVGSSRAQKGDLELSFLLTGFFIFYWIKVLVFRFLN